MDKNTNINLPKLNEKVKIIKESNKNDNEIYSRKNNERNHQKLKIKWIYDSKINDSNSNEKNLKTIISPSLPGSNRELNSELNKKSQGISALFEDIQTKTNLQKTLDKCPFCKSQKFRSTEVFLEQVKMSPTRLEFSIKKVLIMCCHCFKTSELENPKSYDLKKIPQLVESIKNKLAIKIKKQLYCYICRTFYRYQKICPKHNIRLTIPPAIFVRGINHQYKTENILKEEKKVI